MVSFRFLNPRLVDHYPEHMGDPCYRGIGDEPDILCRDLPPNQFRFLGWWYLTPERHFWEWLGFSMVGILVLALLGPKISPKWARSSAQTKNALVPLRCMKVSTLAFYPLVACTKLSWPGSNYPGRWMLFVGMPVGTLWILSVLFCCSSISNWFGRSVSDCSRYKARFWLLETWLSFLPFIVDMLPGLFDDMISSVWKHTHGYVPSGHDGDNATIAYFSHGLYLVLVPAYYVWIDEMSSHPKARSFNISALWTLVVDSTLRQLVGTAICVIYYMGIVTPASIKAGVNVNFLLWGGGGPNFRIHYAARWFYRGCAIRLFLKAVKLVMGMVRRRFRPDGNDNYILPHQKTHD